ncbi:hypothetical protein GCM10008967_32640 [Bacillus carboniphilus]|uniref:Lipoprotein n=1 Tax=Bacillus carboniphilus TaxID=86663 RepID=A0ABP3G9B5_9BACI
MKQLWVILLLIMMALNGCGSGNQTDNNQASNDQKEAAKAEIESRLSTLIEFNNEANETVGYIKGEDFPSFRKELNLIAEGIGIDDKLQINSDDEIKSMISRLETGVDQLTGDEAIQALETMNSSQVIYSTVFKDDFELQFEEVDLTSSGNSLNFFINHESENLTTESDIIEEVESTIGVIEFSNLEPLQDLKAESEKYADAFPEEELTLLNAIINNLTSSIQNQINVLKQLKPVTMDEGSSVDQLLDQAITDYNDAKKSLDELEALYGKNE